MSMVFQEPMTSLNPTVRVGRQVEEMLRLHTDFTKEEIRSKVLETFEAVGLKNAGTVYNSYPHQLSGGMRQRAMIAMALSCNPKLLIADEPTTALDVTIQAQIMKLLKELQQENGMSIILITHDIGLVARMADRVLVMYAGQLIEEAPVNELFKSPGHPYTQALLDSVPTIKDSIERQLVSIPGIVPENYDDMTGCRFAKRCQYYNNEECNREKCDSAQKERELAPGHMVKCSR